MAMLVLPEVFERTWGRKALLFWPRATQAIRERVPDFCFIAEAYWDLESTLQQQGFDYAYDKRLYDRLRGGSAQAVREHLRADLDYQNRLARFLENHDEPRAAATFSREVHEARRSLPISRPDCGSFTRGRSRGCKRISPHLVRAPLEHRRALQGFYNRLLAVIRQPTVRDGQWRLLECRPAWDGNWTWDCFLAFGWESTSGDRLLVTVNYSPNQSQCYVTLPFPELAGRGVQLKELLSSATYIAMGTTSSPRDSLSTCLPGTTTFLGCLIGINKRGLTKHLT